MSLKPGAKAALDEAVGTCCPYCGVIMTREEPFWLEPTRDHMLPKSRGGRVRNRDGSLNIIIVCARCNRDKADLTLQEFHVALEWAGDLRVEHVAALMRLRGLKRLPSLDEANYVWRVGPGKGLLKLGPIEQQKTPQDLRPTGSEDTSELCAS